MVYTDRIRKKVYVVNWDGSGLRELFGGFGLALWRDPRDGREWIYYGLEETQPEGGGHCPAVYRRWLDGSGAGELVWNKTPVSVDSFQLSADGRMAGGNFPWPVGGVAQLPNQSLKTYVKGCWPAFNSAGNRNLYWIFDGAHRNLTMVDLQNEKKWQVNINGAPGIDGYEVYNPRWSNHPRIMAMTGPYMVRATHCWRRPGGGVYVGRFNSDFTAIESWWQATSNDRADFFPDVWVAPAEGGKQKTTKATGTGKTVKEKPTEVPLQKKRNPDPSPPPRESLPCEKPWNGWSSKPA